MKRLTTITSIIFSMIISTHVVSAQSYFRTTIALHLSNAGQPVVTNTFGVAPGASKCTNSVDSALGETELPPPNPAPVLDARLQQASGCTGAEGGMNIDYYPANSLGHSSATFKIVFQLYDATDSSYTFSWDTTGFSQKFDTLTMKSAPAAGALANVNMITTNSVTVTSIDDAYAVRTINIKMGVNPIAIEGIGLPDDNLPKSLLLHLNYPNPFNPSTHIAYDMPKTAKVEVVVYDILGRKIATLINGVQQAGQHTIEWNGKNFAGIPVPSGTYFVRMVSGEFVKTQKILLMK